MLKSTLLTTWMKTIPQLKMQKQKLMYGVWEPRLITAYDQPALGAVYKIVSVEKRSRRMINTIKLSNNAEKVSTQVISKSGGLRVVKKVKSEGDYITYDGVDVSQLTELKMFHPTYTYINKTVRNFEAIPL